VEIGEEAGMNADVLFRPITVNQLTIPNRIVMAPMTRSASPLGVPGPDVADYYGRRAQGGVGVIVTEGTWIPHASAGFNPRVPRFYGEEAIAGWRRVVDAVHAAGGLIFPQLWHVGACLLSYDTVSPGVMPISPSGVGRDSESLGKVMTQADIDEVVEAYADAAATAQAIGCDGVEIHAAHGYLIDQFFWERTNRRTDGYGGNVAERTRFGAEIVAEMRRRVGSAFPIVFRFSQWKLQDYSARSWQTPEELEQFLVPMARAGVDVFHCSTRRFWVPEFEGSALNLAGWTKKIIGLPTISVGSVTLSDELMSANPAAQVETTGMDELIARMEREEFDLVAIGRALIANPSWPQIVRRGALGELRPYNPATLHSLD
jgi:2,4-dienoyl-CoA reductase-like NADH-dependent reductase (Old Yellow Enzyme family)